MLTSSNPENAMDVDGGGLGSGGASLSSASSTGMGSAGFESPTRSGGGSGSAEGTPGSVMQPPSGGEGGAELEDELAGRLQRAAGGELSGRRYGPPPHSRRAGVAPEIVAELWG